MRDELQPSRHRVIVLRQCLGLCAAWVCQPKGRATVAKGSLGPAGRLPPASPRVVMMPACSGNSVGGEMPPHDASVVLRSPNSVPIVL